MFALISGKFYQTGLSFYPLKEIQSAHKLCGFLFYLTKLISEIRVNLPDAIKGHFWSTFRMKKPSYFFQALWDHI